MAEESKQSSNVLMFGGWLMALISTIGTVAVHYTDQRGSEAVAYQNTRPAVIVALTSRISGLETRQADLIQKIMDCQTELAAMTVEFNHLKRVVSWLHEKHPKTIE